MISHSGQNVTFHILGCWVSCQLLIWLILARRNFRQKTVKSSQNMACNLKHTLINFNSIHGYKVCMVSNFIALTQYLNKVRLGFDFS